MTGMHSGAGALASLGPLLGLAQVANGEIDADTYARQYGHRCPDEFEVSIPRPAEDPHWLDQQLAGFAATALKPAVLLARQQATREAAWQRLEQRYPKKAAALGEMLDHGRAVARGRENARSEVIRGFWALRIFILRAGLLTGLGDDLFFLSIEEIIALLRGDRKSLSTVSARRETYRRYRALPPYPSVICGAFDPFAWAADPNRRGDVFDATDSIRPVSDTVTGFPGAAGVVDGLARVISSMAEGDQLRSGEILVTTVTNVGWTPLFPRAGAVVTDVGAPLSHAAIVARELGLPAVVGCGNATMRLRTGDHVRVDGGQGTVEVLG
jgi:phosphohistidine swiveling domain-containing protein